MKEGVKKEYLEEQNEQSRHQKIIPSQQLYTLISYFDFPGQIPNKIINFIQTLEHDNFKVNITKPNHHNSAH